MLKLIEEQLEMGPRHVGSDGHEQLGDSIIQKLKAANLSVETQVWQDESGQKLINIIGRHNPKAIRRVVVATHYDTRAQADRDRKNPTNAVPGANDGASGVAVLLHLSNHILPGELSDLGVDFVFFDAEEFNPGPYDNWRPKGSEYFAKNIQALYPTRNPELAIVPDLVCKVGLRLRPEGGSTQHAARFVDKLWNIGEQVDKTIYDSQPIAEIKDDHTPLNGVGVPSVLLIDLNYPEFHTTHDTIDKCSPKSLEVVYLTIKKFLQEYSRNN